MEPCVEPPGSKVAPSGNIFLVGLMGAGKTAVGRALAKYLGRQFLDSDQEVERATGVRIAVIFDIEGEAGFRAREAKILSELTGRANVVLATGGGVVLSASNRRLLAERGLVVYLHASVADLGRRTRNDRNRPLLRVAEPLAVLRTLYEQRDPLYREVADLVVETGSQSVNTLARRVAGELAKLRRSPAESAQGATQT